MSVTPVIPNLYQIVIPTPFPVGPVNVYLAAGPGEPPTLIDTGPRTRAAQAALEEGLGSLGYTLADVQRVIITHAHSDHHGLAGNIRQASGASVHTHPHNHPIIEDYEGQRARRHEFYATLLAQMGVPDEVLEMVGQMWRQFRRFATAVSPLQALDEGDELQLAGHNWQVCFMPGHAGGLICLYQPGTRLFLSNDHLLRDVSSNPLFEPPFPGQKRRRALVDYVASLERTANMDIAHTWPGHGELIPDHRALIAQRLAFHRRRADKVLAALQSGPQSVYALSQGLFSNLSTMDHFLVVSEVLAHLEWLEVQSAVTSGLQDGLMFWSKA
jgi:glyoxylase-like metal-dependent hydrolase (beta-lactamase superfamily II)